MAVPAETTGKKLHRFGVDSEYGVLRDVLLCSPEHFRWIAWNPGDASRFAAAGPFDPACAHAQHGELVDALTQAGVRCHFVEPDGVMPYQVFTRDSSSMTPWGPVLGKIAFDVRRTEHEQAREFYARNGVPLWHKPTVGTIEGADVMVAWPGLAILSFNGVRSTEEAVTALARRFEEKGWEVLLLPFTREFIHIDVLLSLVAEQVAVVAVDQVPPRLLELLAERRVKVVPVAKAEAEALGCNLIALGHDRVISTADNTRVNDRLRALGFEVLAIEYSAFTTEGGSVHCSTMPLLRDPA